MPPKESLEAYRTKRDFKRTPEPAGGKEEELKHPIYVIQKHDASHPNDRLALPEPVGDFPD